MAGVAGHGARVAWAVGGRKGTRLGVHGGQDFGVRDFKGLGVGARDLERIGAKGVDVRCVGEVRVIMRCLAR